MEPGNPETKPVRSQPRYCRDEAFEACPVGGHLGDFLGSGGCIFCRGGQCTASPLTLAMFSIVPAKSAQAAPNAVERALPPPHSR